MVVKQWQERLAQLLEDNNALHNTAAALREAQDEKSQDAQNLTAKTAKTPNEKSESAQNPTAKTAKTPETDHLDLVATWSHEFGFTSLHDPTTGEWHDLPTNGAPDWAKREAFKRRELYKVGNRKAYRLTSQEMEEVWEDEQVEMWDHPAITDRGIVYEDYLEED